MMMVLDLIVAVLLAALASLSLQGEKSPVWKLRDKIGAAGVAVGLLVFIISLVAIGDGLRLFLHLASVASLLGLGAVHGFDYVVPHLKIKNSVYIDEARGLVEKIEGKQKIISIVSFVLAMFMLVSALSA